MRLSIQIEDQLLCAAKQVAVQSDRTLSAVVEDALRLALFRDDRNTETDSSELPTLSMGAPLPGVDLDNTAALLDLMDEGDE